MAVVQDCNALLRARGAGLLAGDVVARGEVGERVDRGVRRTVVGLNHQLAAHVGAGSPHKGIGEAIRGPAAVGGLAGRALDAGLVSGGVVGGVVGDAGLVGGVVFCADGRAGEKALRAVLALRAVRRRRIGTGVNVGGVEAARVGGDVRDGHGGGGGSEDADGQSALHGGGW